MQKRLLTLLVSISILLFQPHKTPLLIQSPVPSISFQTLLLPSSMAWASFLFLIQFNLILGLAEAISEACQIFSHIYKKMRKCLLGENKGFIIVDKKRKTLDINCWNLDCTPNTLSNPNSVRLINCILWNCFITPKYQSWSFLNIHRINKN